MPPREGTLLRVSGQLKSIAKHRTLGILKRVSCAKRGGPTLTIKSCTRSFCAKSCLLEIAMIASALKFIVALIF